MQNVRERLSHFFGRSAVAALAIFCVDQAYADLSNGPSVLKSVMDVLHGGTGATTAAGARTNLGAAASGVNSDITSLTGLTTPLPFSEGGCGSTTAITCLSALGVETVRAIGDIDTTIAATDKIVYINVNFTTAHTWTLPQASTVNNGHEIIFGDRSGTLTATNTLTISPFAGDTIRVNGGTLVLNEAAARAICTNVNSTFWVCNAFESMAAKASSLYATLASPTFTGSPVAPTQTTADNTTKIATDAFVKAQLYATLASPALTGSPTAPTQTAGDNSTKLATTAYDATAITNLLAAANSWTGVNTLLEGTADATTYCALVFSYGGNSHQSGICGQTTTAVGATATTIWTGQKDGVLLVVNGYDGTSAKFCDLVLANGTAGTFTVVSSTTVAGSPAARTYSTGTLGAFKVLVASGIYGINTFSLNAGGR